MNNHICPFCNSSFPLINSTYTRYQSSFGCSDSSLWDDAPESSINIKFYKCPTCDKISIIVDGASRDLQTLNVPILPNSLAKQFPEYVPYTIREDYEEAYSILNLSPKASATLARRCLQGIIRDFWGIKKSRLVDEINELQDKVTPAQWKAIDALRSIGNIGAHMEKDVNTIIDVEPDEAKRLLNLIELLIDKWYIARHDEEQLLLDIQGIAQDKQLQKHHK